jgi:uncharacterized protein with HEPN domain
MRDEIRAHLHDVIQAGRAIKEFVAGRSFGEYANNDLLRSAVERKFMIMGEALNRIRRDEPEILTRVANHRDIVSFRNILIHGYDSIDDRIVWDIIEEDLDNLIDDVDKLTQ